MAVALKLFAVSSVFSKECVDLSKILRSDRD
jgi:hypothetical protein